MKNCIFNLNFSFLIVLLFSYSVYAEEYIGTAKIIDGDTLNISGTKIRLYGIDSPELLQLCNYPNNNKWKCGLAAKISLTNLIADNIIKCVSKNKDRYNRIIGICYLNEQDIQEWLVKNGWAIAYRRYSKKYIDAEIYASENNLGIWNGNFVEPYKWRKKNK